MSFPFVLAVIIAECMPANTPLDFLSRAAGESCSVRRPLLRTMILCESIIVFNRWAIVNEVHSLNLAKGLFSDELN